MNFTSENYIINIHMSLKKLNFQSKDIKLVQVSHVH